MIFEDPYYTHQLYGMARIVHLQGYHLCNIPHECCIEIQQQCVLWYCTVWTVDQEPGKILNKFVL